MLARTQDDMDSADMVRPTSIVNAIMETLKEQSPAPAGWKKYSSTPARASVPT